MKKILLALICMIIALSLVGCGGETTGGTSANSVAASTEEGGSKFEEIVAVDNEYCTIKITDILPKSTLGYVVKVEIESKSKDKTYVFSTESVGVNGIEIVPFFSAFVEPSKTVQGEIYLNNEVLNNTEGVGEFSDIEFNFTVKEQDEWDDKYLVYEVVRVYPLGKENAKTYVRESKPEDKVVIDNDDFSVVVTGIGKDSFDNYAVMLYLVNKSDKRLKFMVDDASFDGVSAVPYYIEGLHSHRVKFSSILWPQSTFDSKGIKDFKNIEILLSVWDLDNMTNAIYQERLTLNP